MRAADRLQAKRPGDHRADLSPGAGARGVATLLARGVPFEFRKNGQSALDSARASEIDLSVPERALEALEAAMHEAGFRRLLARGQGAHRFYLAQERGRWTKFDVKPPRLGRARLPRWAAAAAAALARRAPAGRRRLGPVVAVLGPDGAGKGTLVASLAARIPVAVSPVYMGRGAGSGVPFTRRPIEAEPRRRPGALREVAFLSLKSVRDWRRLASAYAKAWRGHVVLCDRHPVEVLAVSPERTAIGRRLERAVARHLMPWPDAIVVLDAPADALLRRKREHPAAVLERWRRGYRREFAPRGAVFISTTGLRETAVTAASQVVWKALRDRRRWEP